MRKSLWIALALFIGGCYAASRSEAPRSVDHLRESMAALERHHQGIRANAVEYTIIVAPDPEHPKQDTPRSGELRAKAGEKTIPLPLEHTDVKAKVSLYVASVSVTQKYHNPYNEKIEAVYLFPLPDDAAVRDFIMTIGERQIRGIIREREEAQRIYNEAKRQGYVASLMTQERPNIFTQSVANIEPGKRINIDITYFHTVRYKDGAYDFHFPMVVGPRFNPPGSTGGVGAVPRGAHGASRQATEVEYLAPDERSGHDISLEVDIEAGVTIEKLSSPSHVIDVERPGPTRARVKLGRHDRIPNKDFVLRYSVEGERIRTALATHRDDSDGYFTLVIHPPKDLETIPRVPREMIFVLDCSGSMRGEPIGVAKRAMERCLKRLAPGDTFQIIRFSSNASAMGPRPVPATPENVRRGLRHLAGLNSCGGTMMIEGIKAALDFPHDPERFRIVSFMTDGYIGNEHQIIGEVKKRLGAARIFSFGVGSSPNRYLLEGMARSGRGVAAYVGLDESSERAVDGLYRRIERPAMTDVRIDWGGLQVSNVSPCAIPDLFAGRPVTLVGRFKGGGRTALRITGKVGGRPHEMSVKIDLDEAGFRHTALPALWARSRIAELYHEMSWSREAHDLGGQIRELALQYNLVSAFTSFVAVDSLERTKGDHGTTVPVPVPVPKGVRYDTTVEPGGGNPKP